MQGHHLPRMETKQKVPYPCSSFPTPKLRTNALDLDKIDARPVQDDALHGDMESGKVFEILAAQEEGHDIKYRTMSWQRCALLLFGDQVCLAIMAQPWTMKVLGWVPGLIVQFVSGVLFWITSYTMWQFIMKVRAFPS
jgi:hypothetical protein